VSHLDLPDLSKSVFNYIIFLLKHKAIAFDFTVFQEKMTDSSGVHSEGAAQAFPKAALLDHIARKSQYSVILIFHSIPYDFSQ
jgi:hypothetical protein